MSNGGTIEPRNERFGPPKTEGVDSEDGRSVQWLEFLSVRDEALVTIAAEPIREVLLIRPLRWREEWPGDVQLHVAHSLTDEPSQCRESRVPCASVPRFLAARSELDRHDEVIDLIGVSMLDVECGIHDVDARSQQSVSHETSVVRPIDDVSMMS